MKHSLIALTLVLAGCGQTRVESPPLDGGGVGDTANAQDGGNPRTPDAGQLVAPGQGSSPEAPGFSCLTLKAARPDAEDGLYWINPVGGSTPAFHVYCDMTTDGGGWTLVMKLDGELQTFNYDSEAWGSRSTYRQEQADFDRNEMKNLAYGEVPLTALRMGMLDADDNLRWMHAEVTADSLFTIIFSGSYIATRHTREQWFGMVPDPAAQDHCNRSGFNNALRVRIGMIFNQEEDCRSPDSWIGFGLTGDQHSVGNFADGRWSPEARDTATFGYLLVR
jgi:hypothetical protein